MKSVGAGSLWAGHWPSPAVAFLTYKDIGCLLFSPQLKNTTGSWALVSC